MRTVEMELEARSTKQVQLEVELERVRSENASLRAEVMQSRMDLMQDRSDPGDLAQLQDEVVQWQQVWEESKQRMAEMEQQATDDETEIRRLVTERDAAIA